MSKWSGCQGCWECLSLVKNWSVKIPRLSTKPPKIIEKTVPAGRTSRLLPPPFKRTPIDYSVSPANWVKIQHRMMDEGRAIALGTHPRKVLKQANFGSLFDIQEYIFIAVKVKGAVGDTWFKEYRVRWDGCGDPLILMGVEPDGSNPGGTIAPASNVLSIDSTLGQRAPDSYVWASWFLKLNTLFEAGVSSPIPNDDHWFPFDDVLPSWNILGSDYLEAPFGIPFV